MKYPKIDTLWKREKDGHKKGNIIPEDYSREEFASINRWLITEKIDGINIRVIYENDTVIFHGRTDDAQIPGQLQEKLYELFPVEKLRKMLNKTKRVIIYGEGYGEKIQEPQGSRYGGVGFAVFDILITNDVNGAEGPSWWLEWKDVVGICKGLDLLTVPFIGIETVEQIVERVKSREPSKISNEKQTVEGYVCTAHPMMYYRRHQRPIRFKLKVNDYIRLEQKEEGSE